MVDIYKLDEIGCGLGSSTGVIKRADCATLDTAARIVEDAKRRAAQIIDDAQAGHEAERQRGYSEGVRQAEAHAFAQVLDQQVELDARLAGLEAELAHVVFDLVVKIVGRFDDMSIARNLTRQALQRMRREKRIQLFVSPDLVDRMKEQCADLIGDFPEVELIDVVGDADLSSGDVILQSELGRVTCVLDDALGDLRSILGVS